MDNEGRRKYDLHNYVTTNSKTETFVNLKTNSSYYLNNNFPLFSHERKTKGYMTTSLMNFSAK